MKMKKVENYLTDAIKNWFLENGEGLFFVMAEMLLKKKRVLKNIKTNLFYDLCN